MTEAIGKKNSVRARLGKGKLLSSKGPLYQDQTVWRVLFGPTRLLLQPESKKKKKKVMNILTLKKGKNIEDVAFQVSEQNVFHFHFGLCFHLNVYVPSKCVC